MRKDNYFLLEGTDFSSNVNQGSLSRKQWQVGKEILKAFEMLYLHNWLK